MDPDSQLYVNELYARLEATAALPVDPRTNRWLGEAEAVARDAATNDLDAETTEKRVRQVASLLESADEPENEEAAAHVEAARELCETILE
ncbi:hypothetical protein [Natronobiforma cellulositropha]|uniref:hypothetical protein n=1 Tax=Natronobiforma cellulositropha TaxID=1679076 RepID=UPI0021D5A697|nr:hypothetical protein [Natronobiforma cellulositropha]